MRIWIREGGSDGSWTGPEWGVPEMLGEGPEFKIRELPIILIKEEEFLWLPWELSIIGLITTCMPSFQWPNGLGGLSTLGELLDFEAVGELSFQLLIFSTEFAAWHEGETAVFTSMLRE